MKKKMLVFTFITGLLLSFSISFTALAESTEQDFAPQCIIFDHNIGCWTPPANPPTPPSGSANLNTSGNTTVYQSFHNARRHRVLAGVVGLGNTFGPEVGAGQVSRTTRTHAVGATVFAGIELR